MRVTVILDCVMKRGRHLWISASVDLYSITAPAEIFCSTRRFVAEQKCQ